MARIPEITRRNPLSQVAAQAPASGQGWAALANLAQAGADFMKPAAMKSAAEEGLKSVYRDIDGTLKVKEKSVLGGDLADAHNSAAHAKYLAQRKIDMSQSFTEMAQKYEFDPAGFKKAADGYINIMKADEDVPALLKEDLLLDAQTESQRRFNGLYNMETDRTQKDANITTATQRAMLVDDYVNLTMGGDTKGAEAKYQEILALSQFRESAPYIRDTPAETESFLRGVRGSAKVATLTQKLRDLGGATSISDDFRKEIDDILKDPDISTAERKALYAATGGFLKGIDANAIVDGLAADDYGSKVIRAESGGVATAANPNSSAVGPHQFIAGTWLENVSELRKRGGAEWAKGMSQGELLEMRKSVSASTEVFNHFRAKNAATLAKNGLPVTDATEYMAHFFGAGGAVQVLSADPSAMVKDILPGVIKANPFMANMTVRDAENWAARKMTMKSSDIIRQQTVIDQIDDLEVRAMASSALSDRYNIRKRIEDAAALPYNERLNANDDTLTSQEIMEDHSLSDSAQIALTKALEVKRRAQTEIANTISALNNEDTKWDPYDSGQRKDVNEAYKSIIGDEDPMSPSGQLTAGEIAMNTGALPQASFNAVRAAVNGNDPQALASAMEFMNQVLQRQPNAIGMLDGNTEVLNALADYAKLSEFSGAEGAANQMIEMRSPEAEAKRKNLSDAAKAAAKDLKPKDVTAFFSSRDTKIDMSEPGVESTVMAEYERNFLREFNDTADAGLAKNRALTALSRVYGADEVTGSSRAMKYPPQKFYPQSLTEPDWMRNQIQDEISALVYGDEAFQPVVADDGSTLSMGKRIPLDRIIISSDEITRQEVAAGRRPGYQISYMDDDGELQIISKRYHFDPTAVISAQEAERATYEAKADAARKADEAFRKDFQENFTIAP